MKYSRPRSSASPTPTPTPMPNATPTSMRQQNFRARQTQSPTPSPKTSPLQWQSSTVPTTRQTQVLPARSPIATQKTTIAPKITPAPIQARPTPLPMRAQPNPTPAFATTQGRVMPTPAPVPIKPTPTPVPPPDIQAYLDRQLVKSNDKKFHLTANGKDLPLTPFHVWRQRSTGPNSTATTVSMRSDAGTVYDIDFITTGKDVTGIQVARINGESVR